MREDSPAKPRTSPRFPTALTLGLAAILTLGIARARPAPRTMQEDHGENPARFWAEKASTSGALDVALAGDSRVFRGLAPEEMHASLPGARIGNLGFSGICLCEQYLPFLEGALAAGGQRTIVLGVTAHSLTGHASRDNGFLAERRKTRREQLEGVYLSPLEDALRPLDTTELGLGGKGRRSARYLQDFREGGWVASRLVPENPNGALPEYDRVLRAGRVEPALLSDLVGTVSRWRTKGIRVAAFRPPTSKEMRALERELGGYDEDEVASHLRAAGAEYWEIQPDSYHTYDGSHLTEDSARALSRDVAARLARR